MNKERGMLRIASWLLVLSVVSAMGLRSAASSPTNHQVEIGTFAMIMAVTRTAAERCPGVTIDETVIVAAKDRLHIVDADYFAFRTAAHKIAETLEHEATFGSDPAWCSEALRRFGPGGSELGGALLR